MINLISRILGRGKKSPSPIPTEGTLGTRVLDRTDLPGEAARRGHQPVTDFDGEPADPTIAFIVNEAFQSGRMVIGNYDGDRLEISDGGDPREEKGD